MASSRRGFTLVEISIVLVVIGLVVGGVVGGMSVVQSTKIRSIVSEVASLDSSMYVYKTQYRAFPGDHNRAYDYFDGSGGSSVCGAKTVGASSSCNGNGDGVVSGYENMRVWQHLLAAGYITMEPDSVETEVLPSAHWRKINSDGREPVGYQYEYVTLDYSSQAGHALRLAADNVQRSAVTVEEARRIDKKADDNNAREGFMHFDGPTNDCSGNSGAWKPENLGDVCTWVTFSEGK